MVSPPRPIVPVTRPVTGSIRPPGSKSLTNRAVVLAAMARGESRLNGVLQSIDTRVMLDGLSALGFEISEGPGDGEVRIVGTGGRVPATSANLHLENSGTSIRFLTTLVTLGTGHYTLDGNSRLRQRPIGDLVEALAQLQVDVTCPAGTG